MSGRGAREKAPALARQVLLDLVLARGKELEGVRPHRRTSSSAVCTATAASQPEASAFFTPADDSGSMNDPASPTSSQRSPAYALARYGDASKPRGPSIIDAPSMSSLKTRVLAISAR